MRLLQFPPRSVYCWNPAPVLPDGMVVILGCRRQRDFERVLFFLYLVLTLSPRLSAYAGCGTLLLQASPGFPPGRFAVLASGLFPYESRPDRSGNAKGRLPPRRLGAGTFCLLYSRWVGVNREHGLHRRPMGGSRNVVSSQATSRWARATVAGNSRCAERSLLGSPQERSVTGSSCQSTPLKNLRDTVESRELGWGGGPPKRQELK